MKRTQKKGESRQARTQTQERLPTDVCSAGCRCWKLVARRVVFVFPSIQGGDVVCLVPVSGAVLLSCRWVIFTRRVGEHPDWTIISYFSRVVLQGDRPFRENVIWRKLHELMSLEWLRIGCWVVEMVRREIKERRRKEENCFSWRKQFDCFVTSMYIPFLSRLCDVHPTHALTHTHTQK